MLLCWIELVACSLYVVGKYWLKRLKLFEVILLVC